MTAAKLQQRLTFSRAQVDRLRKILTAERRYRHALEKLQFTEKQDKTRLAEFRRARTVLEQTKEKYETTRIPLRVENY